jgi:hypothetical protein
MAAAKPAGEQGPVQFRFRRDGRVATDWMASASWRDSSLASGARYGYSVQARDAAGNVGPWCAAQKAVAQDRTPPKRYNPGEWQTRPLATVENRITMTAMSVTGQNGCPTIENGPVEYKFECATGSGPSSDWQSSPKWVTPPLPDGKYSYRFKIRDLSPRRNETAYSSAEPVEITPFTGYHPTEPGSAGRLPDGHLVKFTGRVAMVKPDRYVVEGLGGSVEVVPATKGDQTDSAMSGWTVEVSGCVWTVAGAKRVTWAAVVAK